MKIDIIQDRWLHGEGLNLFQSLQRDDFDLRNKDLWDHDGRIDLRGLKLSGTNPFKKNVFDNVDFSSSIFSGVSFEQVIFRNSLFKNSKLNDCKFWDCTFENVVLENCDLHSSLLGGQLGDNSNQSGSFLGVDLIKCDLTNAVLSNPIFNQCVFSHCKLDAVDFNGSRFLNCKFSGRLKETIFRGVPRINRRLFPHRDFEFNTMENVDFRDASLESVSFIDKIDLSSCLFPSGENYLLIKRNRSLVFEEARDIINANWTGVQKKIGLNLIDKHYLKIGNRELKTELIDKKFMTSVDVEFADLFFSLLKDLVLKFDDTCE